MTDGEMIIAGKQDLTKTSINVKQDLPKYWDKDFINDKLDWINNYQHRMLLTFLWRTGVRITEAISLRKQDINFPEYVMTIRWLKSRKYHYRVVPLHPEIRDMLQIYTAAMKTDDIIFPITRQRAWQISRKVLGGSPHQLRHSFAVNWLRCDGDLVILHKILGHSKIQTTMEYLKIVPVDQGKELLKIKFK